MKEREFKGKGFFSGSAQLLIWRRFVTSADRDCSKAE